MLMGETQKVVEAAAAEALSRIQRDRSRAPRRIKPLLAYIEQHLFDPGLDVNQLKRSCGVRDNSVPIQFHAAVGRPPHAYIEDCRMQTACRLLAESDLKVWQIAEHLGYSSIQVFSRAFSRWAGTRPTAYRKKARQKKAAAGGNGRQRSGEALTPTSMLRLDFLRRAVSGELEGPEARALIERLAQLYPGGRRGTDRPLPPDAPVTAHGSSRIGEAEGVPMSGFELDLGKDQIEAIRAEEVWSLIRDRSPQEQREFLYDGVRFSTPALFELLHGEARKHGRDDPGRGVELAQLALETLELIDFDEDDETVEQALRARGWTWLANARRRASDFRGAEQALHVAERWLESLDRKGVAYAEYLHIKASLGWDLHRLDEALDLIGEAIELYRRGGDPQQVGQALVTRSLLHHHKGEPAQAIPDLREALELIDADSDPFLTVTAYQNLAMSLMDTGELDEARELLLKAHELDSEVDCRDVHHRLRWLEGLLALHDGDTQKAEKLLRETRTGFLRLDKPLSAALASLDLAVVYAMQQRSQEVVDLCSEILPLFDALEVHREVLMASRLLRGAVEQREVSVAALEKIRSTLDPGYGEPSLPTGVSPAAVTH